MLNMVFLFLTLLTLFFSLCSSQNTSISPPPPLGFDLCKPIHVAGVPAVKHCFNALYVFGNSLEDVGNFAVTYPGFLVFPYGSTNPGYPKGRFSDGALLVDFIAYAFKLPATVPSQACHCGTNFAFAGATVLSSEYYEERQIRTAVNVSFANETQWFISYKKHCRQELEKDLFIVGGGGDDYTYEALAGLSPSQIINSTVNLVVNKIVKTVEFLISNCAKNILVLNIPQTSCTPLYLDVFQDPEGLNEYGCLAGYGRIVDVHNERLMNALSDMYIPRGVNIAIANRYRFLYDVLRDPTKYGGILDTHDACCGGGGQHNGITQCGTPGATVCGNPNLFVYFDQVHFTENFNRQEALAYINTRKYVISVTTARYLSLVDLCKPFL